MSYHCDMTLRYSDSSVNVHVGNCIDVLRTLPAESVHCVVTSPPYWGLRTYLDADDPAKVHELGCEPTPQEYVANLVAVFREVRRVLRDDGQLWLNVGDSYAAQGGGKQAGLYVDKRTDGATWQAARTAPAGLKPKDLCMIPARVALALQDDGWYLRSEITWIKRNPMPESVTDRPTSSTEKIYLLTKSPTYYYDQDAVREPNADHTENVARNGWVRQSQTKVDASRCGAATQSAGQPAAWHNPAGRNMRNYLSSNEPRVRLRTDLSEDARAYVLGELLKRGL